MNIHSECSFLPDGAVLPDESIKGLGIHSEGFYFLIHRGNEILYALLGSFRNGITASSLMAVTGRRPEFRMAELDHLIVMPRSFVAIPNDFLKLQNDRQLYEMVNVLPESFQILKSEIKGTDTSLLSAFHSDDLLILNQLISKNPLADMTAAWVNKIKVSDKGNSAHMLIFPSSFVIAVFTDGRLQLINSFNYSDKSNFLYYTLGAIKACKCNPDSTELMLRGLRRDPA